jgi:hypothetical protein
MTATEKIARVRELRRRINKIAAREQELVLELWHPPHDFHLRTIYGPELYAELDAFMRMIGHDDDWGPGA